MVRLPGPMTVGMYRCACLLWIWDQELQNFQSQTNNFLRLDCISCLLEIEFMLSYSEPCFLMHLLCFAIDAI